MSLSTLLTRSKCTPPVTLTLKSNRGLHHIPTAVSTGIHNKCIYVYVYIYTTILEENKLLFDMKMLWTAIRYMHACDSIREKHQCEERRDTAPDFL